jgi:hypothetical protein
MVIAVDFDGTIVEHRYPRIGAEIPFAVETLKLIQTELKHTLILWTVREGELLEEAMKFCTDRGLYFYAINSNEPGSRKGEHSRKIVADLYLDDRNFGGLPDWGFIYRSLKERPDLCLTTEIFREAPVTELPKKRRGFFR